MKNKNKLLAFLVIGIFFLSVSGHVTTVSGQDEGQIETNFELLLMTNAGNRIRESYAFYVKQAVAPLGIKVDVLAKPFGQFVGDLLHFSTGQPFDLAIVSLTGGTVPSFWDTYGSTQFFGAYMYQLYDEGYAEWQEQDIGWTVAEVDELLYNFEFTLDPIQKLDYLNEFAELFMDQLLYDLPLTVPESRVALWKGYGGPNNELVDLYEGLIDSQKLGARWESNPATRSGQSGNETLVFRTGDANSKEMMDTYRVADVPTGEQSNDLISSLLSFDGQGQPHPELAAQWYITNATTWDASAVYTYTNTTDNTLRNYDGTILANQTHNFMSQKEASRHVFVLNTNFTFSETTDKDGVTIPAHNIDANDVALALDYLMHPNTTARGDGWKSQVANYSVSTTVETDDTITIDLHTVSVTDYSLLGSITPLPSHLLGGDLTFVNATGTDNDGATYQVNQGGDFSTWAGQAWAPESSEEWKHWSSPDGVTYAGPYELQDAPKIGVDFWSFSSRGDYQFVNEETSHNFLDAKSAEFEAAHGDAYNGTWNDGGLAYFAPHLPTIQDESHYWAFDGFNNEFLINELVYKVISDDNAALIEFENGGLDSFSSSRQGAGTVAAHIENDELNVISILPTGSPTFMVYNLLNEHLKKRDVRYAIAQVIDKVELTEVNDGFAAPAHSPVAPVYDVFPLPDFIGAGEGGSDLSWYTPYAIPVDYESARDLMRANGYVAQDSDDIDEGAQDPPVGNVLNTIGELLGYDAWIGLSAFAITSVVLVRKARNRYD